MKQVSSALNRILKADCCTGCGACAGISDGAIGMRLNSGGFLRPHQSAPITSQTDELISEICPGLGLEQTSSEGSDHPLWGPLIAVRTGASTDPKLRHHASSGGALSALLLYLLDTRSVDRIVQVSASETSPIETETVESLSAADVYRAAGSRYAPSAPLADVTKQLAMPGTFALVGKPCDIAALRALGRHDARVEGKAAILLSFFCAGVPSLLGSRAILGRLGVEESALTGFRYRGDGWPGRCTATLDNGRQAGMSYAESWGGVLSKHLQFRCKICPDGSGGFADIVCGDAWHCDANGYPLLEEEDGRSLIITRTARGEALVREAIAAGYLTAETAGAEDVERMLPSQARRKRLIWSRLAAMAVLGHRLPRFRGFHLARAAVSAGLGQNTRSFLGMARRLVNRLLNHSRHARGPCLTGAGSREQRPRAPSDATE